MDTIRRAQASLHYGKVPKEEIFDGICILIGAIFLITPGFITDILGFIFILPVTRGIFKTRLYKLVKKMDRKKIPLHSENGKLSSFNKVPNG